MNRKNMPLLLMLIAGACTWIVTLVRSYSLLASLVALFTVMLLFYCLGSVIRLLLDRFDRQNEEKANRSRKKKRRLYKRKKLLGHRRTQRRRV
ncbi:MAG: hypothetical protein ACLR6I_17970 [Waltera sp.]